MSEEYLCPNCYYSLEWYAKDQQIAVGIKRAAYYRCDSCGFRTPEIYEDHSLVENNVPLREWLAVLDRALESYYDHLEGEKDHEIH